MTATQLLTGQGGWPNSLFLTPDLLPFFAGTYFPPTDRLGRPGFATLLSQIAEAWNAQGDALIAQAALSQPADDARSGTQAIALPLE